MIRSILLKSFNKIIDSLTNTCLMSFLKFLNKLNLLSNTASYRFQFSNFRYYFTLFSKFFSSFPHGTCSLSVSHQYLALDGIYHPLRAAVPNNSTRWKQKTLKLMNINGAVTLHGASFQKTWFIILIISCFSRQHFRRLNVWAIPGSLAVTKGILVSFFSSA
jgi:hypothetical protein